MRQSIEPTYDHRQTGDRFTFTSKIDGRTLHHGTIPDPFVFHRITLGWRDLLRGLLRRRLEIIVMVDGDHEIVEDVCELNADYTGLRDSTRNKEWKAQIDRSLGDLAARLAEHEE